MWRALLLVPLTALTAGRRSTRSTGEATLRLTPGAIAMMLNETSGLRVQTTSPRH